MMMMMIMMCKISFKPSAVHNCAPPQGSVLALQVWVGPNSVGYLRGIKDEHSSSLQVVGPVSKAEEGPHRLRGLRVLFQDDHCQCGIMVVTVVRAIDAPEAQPLCTDGAGDTAGWDPKQLGHRWGRPMGFQGWAAHGTNGGIAIEAEVDVRCCSR